MRVRQFQLIVIIVKMMVRVLVVLLLWTTWLSVGTNSLLEPQVDIRVIALFFSSFLALAVSRFSVKLTQHFEFSCFGLILYF